jgi:hypothetical protein
VANYGDCREIFMERPRAKARRQRLQADAYRTCPCTGSTCKDTQSITSCIVLMSDSHVPNSQMYTSSNQPPLLRRDRPLCAPRSLCPERHQQVSRQDNAHVRDINTLQYHDTRSEYATLLLGRHHSVRSWHGSTRPHPAPALYRNFVSYRSPACSD